MSFAVSPLRSLLAASLLLGTALTAFAGTAIGYRNDGSGVYPEAKPVTAFDDAKGTNILWKTPLPNFGSGCPIVVKDRVYVVCDPTMAEAQPALLCYDINTGKLLWQQEVNHLDEFPAEEAATARKQWLETRDYEAKRNVFINKAIEMKDKTGAEYAAIFAELKALGVPDKSLYDNTPEKKPYTNIDDRLGDSPVVNNLRSTLLKKYNLDFCTWQRWGGMNFGDTFPTPVSDGENIYVEDDSNVVVCYSLDGAKKWVRIFTDNSAKKGLSWPGRNKFTSSPVLVGDVLVLSLGGYYRGIDKATGKSLWQFAGDPGGGEYRADTPRALRLGDTDVVIMPDRSVVRISDGKVLATNIIGHSGPADLLVDGSTVISATAEGLSAITLVLDTPDTVKATPLWTNVEVKDQRNTVSAVLRDGVIYTQNWQYIFLLDELTGKTIAKVGGAEMAVGGLVIAGDYLFALNDKGNVAVVKTGRDAKLVSKNTLLVDDAEGAKAEQRIKQSGYRSWNFTRSQPTFSGDKVIIRSNDNLYCLGEKAK